MLLCPRLLTRALCLGQGLSAHEPGGSDVPWMGSLHGFLWAGRNLFAQGLRGRPDPHHLLRAVSGGQGAGHFRWTAAVDQRGPSARGWGPSIPLFLRVTPELRIMDADFSVVDGSRMPMVHREG